MPKVSVCVPVYNGGSFIRNTLEMILEQDYDDYEIVVSDNRSEDNTIEEIEKVKSNRIRFLQNEKNIGMVGNWNTLIHQAKGEYIIIVCADDVIYPGALRSKAEILDKYPNVSIVTSASYVIDKNGKKLFCRRLFKKDMYLNSAEIINKFFVERNLFGEPSNNMFRKDALIKAGDFDTSLWYTVDWDEWIRLMTTGDGYYLNTPQSGFRIYATSTSGSNLKEGKDKIISDGMLFLEKYKKGNIIHITKKMSVCWERNYLKRLNQRILFFRLLHLYESLFG